MKRLFGIGSVVLAMSAVPTLAQADEGDARVSQPSVAAASEDIIHLRNGGLYRGRVMEIVPGDHVTINVTGGETKRIAWPEVDRVIVASTTLPPPPTATAPVGSPMVGPRVLVHLKGVNKAILFRHPAGTSELVQACEAPCDIEVPLGDSYKIGGPGITTTNEFRLHASPGGSVELTVDGPSWLGIVGGGAMVVGGAATAYVGVLLALAGQGCADCYEGKDVRNAGIVVTIVGAAMIGVGLVIVFPSMKTDLTQESSPARAAEPKRDAFVRAPVWNTASATTERNAPPATFPALFERHF